MSVQQGYRSTLDRHEDLSFTHRPAIDGLRAIAALLVVLFHAGMPGMDNGFVGVDVFFVLSGFLITSLVVRDRLTTGRVNFARFYARRVKRLLPAALLVLVVTAVVYDLVASPLAVMENKGGFLAAALYVANWYFLARSSDYFAQEAAPSPVQHYWSLSVEEQFYLLWPLLLAALFAFSLVRRRLAPIILVAVAAVATLLSAVLSRADLMDAYFGTHGRAYQLLCGAALGVGFLWWRRRRTSDLSTTKASGLLVAVASVAMAGGLLALIGSATSGHGLDPWFTGLVGVGATLVVLAGIELSPHGPTSRLLSTPVLRALGRWSYSIYLWHWPVIVLGDTAGLLPTAWVPRTVLVTGLSIGLAALTYRLLERPFLRMRLPDAARMRRVIVGGLVATVTAALLLTVLLRTPPEIEELGAVLASAEAAEVEDGVSGDIVVQSAEAERTKKIIMLVGDSHASMWRKGVRQFGRDHGQDVVYVTMRGCPWASVDAVRDFDHADMNCKETLRAPSLAEAKRLRPDVVILGSRTVETATIREDGALVAPGEPGWLDRMQAGVDNYLERLSRHAAEIIILEPLPETSQSVPVCLAAGGSGRDCDFDPAYQPMHVEVVTMLREVAGRHGARTVDLSTVICPDGSCPGVYAEGLPTHRDTHHLTFEYAEVLFPKAAHAMSLRKVLGVSDKQKTARLGLPAGVS